MAPILNHYKQLMAKQTEKQAILLDNGRTADASAPVIVSASRSTDIPAFYCDWFFARLKKGYSAWINPFNRKKSYISYARTRFIVFWSKNPAPLLPRLDWLAERGIGCYVHFSLNNYEKDGIERGLPPLANRISAFRALADKLGKAAVIWRFDPLLLTDQITPAILLARIRSIAAQIHTCTEKLVFSFADILNYARVRTNLDKNHIPYRDWTPEQMREFSAKLLELNKSEGWHLQIATCGELTDLPGIERNRCVDDRLILRLSSAPEVWEFLSAEPCQSDFFGARPPGAIDIGGGKLALIRKNNRDKGQRDVCGCVKSKDIGQYNTCPHLCEYCYANYSKEGVRRSLARHMANPFGELISCFEQGETSR